MKNIYRAGLVAGLVSASGYAWATPCEYALSSYASYVSSGYSESAAEIVSNHPECFGGSPGSSLMSINSTSFVLAFAIGNALALRQSVDGPTSTARVASAGVKGMAAGGAASKWNAWGNLNNNDTRQSYTAANGFKSKNNADIMTTVLGVDYGLSPTMALGVSAAFDDGDGSGRNYGPGGTKNTTDSSGYVIAPYFGMQLSKALSFDVSAGMGRGKIDTSTNTDSRADRWFAAANLNYNRWFDNIQLTGRVGYLHGVEDYDDIENSATGVKFAGTDAKNTLDQIRLGGQVGYWMNGVMPFASLAYTNDVGRKTTQFGVSGNPIGRDAWVWGLGMNFYSVKDGVAGGVTYNEETGRNNQTNRSLMANINIHF